MTREIMEKIHIFETKIKNIRELIIDTIEYDYDKLIDDLNMEKGQKPNSIVYVNYVLLHY